MIMMYYQKRPIYVFESDILLLFSGEFRKRKKNLFLLAFNES